MKQVTEHTICPRILNLFNSNLLYKIGQNLHCQRNMNTGPLIAKQSKKLKQSYKKKPYKSSLSCVVFIFYVHTWHKEPGNETWCNMPPPPHTKKGGGFDESSVHTNFP